MMESSESQGTAEDQPFVVGTNSGQLESFSDALGDVVLWTGVGAVCGVLFGVATIWMWNRIVDVLERGDDWSPLTTGLVAGVLVLGGGTFVAAWAAMGRINTDTPLDHVGEFVVFVVVSAAMISGMWVGRQIRFPSRY